jgi:hypothetical protein
LLAFALGAGACAQLLALDDVSYSPGVARDASMEAQPDASLDAKVGETGPDTDAAPRDAAPRPCDASAVVELVARYDGAAPGSLASNGTDVLWTVASEVVRRLADGGTEELGVATLEAGLLGALDVSPYAAAFASATLEGWVSLGGGAQGSARGTVLLAAGIAVSRDPGPPTVFASGGGAITACPPDFMGCVYITSSVTDPRVLGTAGSTFYYFGRDLDGGPPGLLSNPVSIPRQPTELLSPINPRSGAAIDRSGLDPVFYFVDGTRVVAFQKGMDAAAPIAQDEPGAAAVAIDAKHVYWLTASGVRYALRSGGEACDVASVQPAPTSIAVDGTHVYWTAGTSVWRAAK